MENEKLVEILRWKITDGGELGNSQLVAALAILEALPLLKQVADGLSAIAHNLEKISALIKQR